MAKCPPLTDETPLPPYSLPMDTKTKTIAPLLTDEKIERMTGDPVAAQAVSGYEFGKCIGMARGLSSARDLYEAERTKHLAEITRLKGTTHYETVPKEEYDRLRELAQTLCNAIQKNMSGYGQEWEDALSLAAEQGITPTPEQR